MDFPIVELMDRDLCQQWLERYFHPEGLHCLHCQARQKEARWFRQTKRSQVDVYRCERCDGVYNVYSGTVFAGRQFRPEQAILMLRGVCQRKSSAQLARELELSRPTVLEVRHLLQANAELEQADTALTDAEVETDEMFQNAGEKRRKARRPGRPAPNTGQQTAWPRHLCQ